MKAEFQNPLIRGMACAALNSGLRSILVFDASPPTLQTMASLLAQMVAVVNEEEAVWPQSIAGNSVRRTALIQLGTVETEEELWGDLTLGQDILSKTIVWREGLLSAGQHKETRIILIPDLSRLSLAASRACVTLMGAEVAHLERHGQSDRWQPLLFWLAGCSCKHVGMLSPHLLDRFALRLNGRNSSESEQREAQLRSWFAQFDQKYFFGNEEKKEYPLPAEIMDCLQKAKQIQPEVLPEAREKVLNYVDMSKRYSTRRDLALLRLARANAQLLGAAKVTGDAVDEAAAMIGLLIQQSQPEISLPDSTELIESEVRDDTLCQENSAFARDRSQLIVDKSTSVDEEAVFKSNTEENLPSISLPLGTPAVNPYIEDTVESEREAASLRLPPRRFQSASLGRGAIIGVEPTTVPRDLALVSTLLEAAKYQKLRWGYLQDNRDTSAWAKRWLEKRVAISHVPLILQASDLRRYRRTVVPEQMLALVLDHTCLQNCNWQEALLPYLQWAYEERASVCLIQVGAVNAHNELQAEKITADKILFPKIRSGLNVGRGRATPLAHGLDLVLQTVCHKLRHGRSSLKQVVLVVVSDGRGNVPLKASQTGKVILPVGQQGIEDARQVAQQIAGLKEVKSVLLNPQPKHYRDLPVKLAQALGAGIAEIAPLKVWEVEE